MKAHRGIATFQFALLSLEFTFGLLLETTNMLLTTSASASAPGAPEEAVITLETPPRQTGHLTFSRRLWPLTLEDRPRRREPRKQGLVQQPESGLSEVTHIGCKRSESV